MKQWHPYSHHAQARATVAIVVLGVLSAWALGAVVEATRFIIPWYIDAPAVFGFYGLLYKIYDRFVWRVPPFLALHGVPNLNGIYDVVIKSSYDRHSVEHQRSLVIVQSWSRIAIRLEGGQSSSNSEAAWLLEVPGGKFTVGYTYTNTPGPSAPPMMHQHSGTAELTFDSARNASGSYYSGRGRKNIGEIEVKPVKPK